MLKILTALRWAGCAAMCASAGCVAPGSLDDKAEFQRLLGLGDPSNRDGGGGASGADSGAAASGCPEACEIIATRCATAGCHVASGSAAGLDLESENLVTRLSDKSATTAACASETLLDTASPQDSLLYRKLLDPPACGIRMPLGMRLDDAEIDCMRRWLDDPQCGEDAPPQPASDAGMDASEPPTPEAGMDAGTDASIDASIDAMVPEPNGSVWIEAEATGTLTAPLAVASDAMASGGEFISVPIATALAINATPDASLDGIASYIFNVGTDASYRIWGRVRIASTGNDSFWVRVDGGTWFQWNNIPVSADWQWDDVHDTGNMDTLITFDLTAGQHTLNFAYREIGTELDKILITDDAALVPTGEGQ